MTSWAVCMSRIEYGTWAFTTAVPILGRRFGYLTAVAFIGGEGYRKVTETSTKSIDTAGESSHSILTRKPSHSGRFFCKMSKIFTVKLIVHSWLTSSALFVEYVCCCSICYKKSPYPWLDMVIICVQNLSFVWDHVFVVALCCCVHVSFTLWTG